MDAHERLDVRLLREGLILSRSRAQLAIAQGLVLVNGLPAQKPSQRVSPSDRLEVCGDPVGYVGRGGIKLEKALTQFGVDAAGLTVLDAGASTGGFTDCLLKHGAKKVYAVDVGRGQLAQSLREDPRVVCMEGVNIRDLTPDKLGEKADLITCDLSFISLRLVLSSLFELLKDDGQALCLVKPQFEAGRGAVGKNGVVRDAATHLKVLTDLIGACDKTGFSVKALTHSPIRGPEGNIEYLAHLNKSGTANGLDVAAVVRLSHDAFRGDIG